MARAIYVQDLPEYKIVRALRSVRQGRSLTSSPPFGISPLTGLSAAQDSELSGEGKLEEPGADDGRNRARCPGRARNRSDPIPSAGPDPPARTSIAAQQLSIHGRGPLAGEANHDPAMVPAHSVPMSSQPAASSRNSVMSGSSSGAWLVGVPHHEAWRT